MAPNVAPQCLSGRYRLEDRLGQGGMGEVWAGQDLRLGRKVAVKVLRRDLAALDEPRRRFEHEAQAAAQLAHPNVVSVFDTGEDDGVPFIVMERLEGETLQDVVARGPMPAPAVRALAVQILSALAVAHRAGILHRDLKPSNVLRGPQDSWKLADFGIAKSVEAAADLTVTGLVPGTPRYLAPERLAGDPATPAADLYSVGVTLYEAVSGCPPFGGDSTPAIVHAVRRAGAAPLRQVQPDVDPGLARVIERAMQPDPRRRYPNADAMRAALAPRRRRPADATEPDATRPGASSTRLLPEPPRPSARRHRGLVALGAAAALVAVVLALVLGTSTSTSSPGSPASSSPPSAPAVSTPATPGPSTPLPAPLAGALQRLDQQVRP
jgi:eukaryotic-like serine/threonine-protein kinase